MILTTPPIAFTIVPFSWRACSSLAFVYKIVYLANPYFLCASYAGQTKEKSNTFTVKLPLPKQITRASLRMDSQVLGSIAVCIYLSDLAFCVPDTFYAKFPVLVKSVFKTVTRALPLRPTPNQPATSKLRDMRRRCLSFRAKGELRGRARSESVSLVHSVKLPNKLTGATPHATKNLRHPG